MHTQPKLITRLKETIRKEHSCEALYIRTVSVDEASEGVTPWHGLVGVFELIGHPQAECCYVWTCGSADDAPSHAVLQVPPVDSPAAAVRAAFAAYVREAAD